MLVYSRSHLKPKPVISAFIHLVFTIFLVFQIHMLDPTGCHGPLLSLKSSFLHLSYICLIPPLPGIRTGGLGAMGRTANFGMVGIW